MDRITHLFDDFYQDLAKSCLQDTWQEIDSVIDKRLVDYTHGFMSRWLDLLEALPDYKPETLDLINSVSVAMSQSLSEDKTAQLLAQLKQLKPWRKGPYHIHGIHIDTEWRSDWKWQRIKPHIASLNDKVVLDIGCGNGYHCWLMHGQGAKLVIGIDPAQLFWMQFNVIKHFIGPKPVHLLPVGVEDLPIDCYQFDTVFSMGVLYHRKSPFDHLEQLKSLLKEGGELVLETLVIDGDENTVLMPEHRYASMRNVWFLPSPLALEGWLNRAGFKHIKLIECNQTTLEEQRQTDWVDTHSLQQFLDPNDLNKTIEGYPAPKRATFIASV